MVFLNDMNRNLSPANKKFYPDTSSGAIIFSPPWGANWTIRLMIHCHCKLLVLLLQRVSGLQPGAGTGMMPGSGNSPFSVPL
jgi:hypothetical protein